jgi:hypothetical protein
MQIEPTWWISVIEVPIVAALFRMMHGLKQEIQNRIDRGDTRDSEAVSRTREDLAEFKLEVARTYVPLSLIRDLDQRVSGAPAVEHVLDADAAYLRPLGGNFKRSKDGDVAEDMKAMRRDFVESFNARARGEPPDLKRPRKLWLPRYAVRRSAWHALDHAWEIEDRAV